MSKFMQELFSKNFLTGNVFKKNNLSALKLDKIKHRLENCLHLFFSQGKMICVFRLITKTNGCTKQKLINGQ